MRRIIRWLLDAFTTIEFIRNIGVVLVVGGAIWLAIREWVKGLDTGQWIILSIALFGVLIVVITYLYEWRRNRSIKYIPKLLREIDELTKVLIQNSEYPSNQTMISVMEDLFEIFNIDVVEVRRTMRYGNKVEIRKMFNEKLADRPNPVPTQSLYLLYQALFYIKSTLNTYNVGLESIKNDELRKLGRKLDGLRDRVKKGTQIKAITDYNNWWEGFCSFLLLLHHDTNYPVPPEILPAKIRVVMPNIQKQIEGIIRNLLGDVQDKIFEK